MTDYADAALIDRLLEREGETYTDWKSDRGGPTKCGVTLRALRAWRKNMSLTSADVEKLTREEAEAYYREVELAWWGDVPAGPLKELLLDCGVLHGRQRTLIWLQKALGVEPDGVWGPETRGALALLRPEVWNQTGVRLNESSLIKAINRARLRHLGRLVHLDPTQAVNVEGWLNRAGEFL